MATILLEMTLILALVASEFINVKNSLQYKTRYDLCINASDCEDLWIEVKPKSINLFY